MSTPTLSTYTNATATHPALSADPLPHALTAALQTRDLADPAQGRHGMQLLVTAISNALSARWDIPAEIG